ncbi:hypothetical protein C8Q76DRAFT_181889 [Earliella scabrosa]|nr:hypothetical protein C8Q76DRAFT_181889 [Earliella scabrosa]
MIETPMSICFALFSTCSASFWSSPYLLDSPCSPVLLGVMGTVTPLVAGARCTSPTAAHSTKSSFERRRHWKLSSLLFTACGTWTR